MQDRCTSKSESLSVSDNVWLPPPWFCFQQTNTNTGWAGPMCRSSPSRSWHRWQRTLEELETINPRVIADWKDVLMSIFPIHFHKWVIDAFLFLGSSYVLILMLASLNEWPDCLTLRPTGHDSLLDSSNVSPLNMPKFHAKYIYTAPQWLIVSRIK